MELLTVRNLSLEYRGRSLVSGVELTLREGMRLGVTGRNGSGKSTLLRALAGVQPPASGTVRRAPGIEVGYLPQRSTLDPDQNAWEAALTGLSRIRRLESELRLEEERLARGEGSLEVYGGLREVFERSGGYAAEALLREQLAALGLADEQLELDVGDLSGGERARLALARVLAAEPQLLILDEPTNHLDLPALQWLGERLRRWRGGLLLVSHDRELLDQVTTHTAELRDERLEIGRGGYSRWREQQGVSRRTSERRERERRKEAARLEGIARELRTWGNAGAQRRRRRAERRLDELGPPEPAPGDPQLPRPRSREASGRLLEARHLSSIAAHRKVVDDVQLSIFAGNKIALLGPNGSGKSTLLRLIAGELPSDDPRVEFWHHRDSKLLYSGQHDRGLDDAQSVADQLQALVSRERAGMLLSLVGLPPDRRGRRPVELSGGERARAGLARLLAAEANLLLLDEPSNDLDLNAIETLHQTLATSDAAVVFATHDRALARLADRVWSLEGGELVEYRGGLEGYLAGRRRIEPGVDRSEEREPAIGAREGRAAIGAGDGRAAIGARDERGGEPAIGARDGRAAIGTGVERAAIGAGDERGGEPGVAAPSEGQPNDELERLELERLGIEARLDDPLRLSERERQRLQERLRELIDRLSEAYDRRLPPPGPAFSVRHGALRLTADLTASGLSYGSDAPVEMSLIVRQGVGHLRLREAEGHALLPWARTALLDGAVRLAFYALAPRVVQYYSREPLASNLLQPYGAGWWTVDRRRFEEREGWSRPQPVGRPAPRPPTRRRRPRGRAAAGRESG